MSEEKKKDYLKKNFIQPLTETLPLTCEYFTNTNLEQCISVNQNFANYIQFDLKTITDDLLQRKRNSQSQQLKSDSQNQALPDFKEDIMTHNNVFLNPSFNLKEIALSNFPAKNITLKQEEKAELDIERFCIKIDELSKDESLMEDSVRI